MGEELRKLAKAMRDMSDMVGDLHWMAAKAVEDLIRLRGEIAKRDARIVELENAAESLRITRDYHHEQEVKYRRRWAGLIAAPVSEAKAQGVVMPERANASHGSHDHQSGWNECLKEVARLNTAPVQQVSVPVTGEPSIKCWSCHSVVSLDDRADADGNCPHCRVELDLEEYLRAMLAAAPAAPAADAGLVEALALCVKSLDQLLPYLGKVPADIGLLNDALMAARPALAAHRAQGVV